MQGAEEEKAPCTRLRQIHAAVRKTPISAGGTHFRLYVNKSKARVCLYNHRLQLPLATIQTAGAASKLPKLGAFVKGKNNKNLHRRHEDPPRFGAQQAGKACIDKSEEPYHPETRHGYAVAESEFLRYPQS